MTGLAYLGPALAPEGGTWAILVEEQARLTLGEGQGEGGRVREALRLLDASPPEGFLTVALLGYEAGVALDGRAPRHPGDATLGPDVVIWRARPAPRPSHDAAAPRLQIAALPGARGRHLARVGAARERVFDGVIYQANLAHRLRVAPTHREDALGFFLAALGAAPPPCAAWLDVDGFGSVVSLSPERFVTIDERSGVARAYPIKGTRPRGGTPTADAALLAELCASEKDAAEHVMIVDLMRNDLGRVAAPGGVTVERLLDVVTVKNVHHLESTVAARLREGVGRAEVLAAVLPGGSITGAPKSSAVETIAELEDGPRGLYTGVLVVVDAHGSLRSSLLIRTWLRPDQGAGALHVGGGIVADSDGESEWQETLAKARAFGEVSSG